MAQRVIGKALTSQEKKKVTKRIKEVRVEIGFNIGDPITYDLIATVQTWILSRFNYRSDIRTFNKQDFFNTQAFEWLMLDDYLDDDCDGMGYALIEFFIRVLSMPRHLVHRVACTTETLEGHFVCWVISVDSIYYQVENRVMYPRTLRYMRDVVGYTYMAWSTMSREDIKIDRWYEPAQKVQDIIDATPKGLSADLIAYTLEGRGKDEVIDNLTLEEAKAGKLSSLKAGAVDMLDSVKYVDKSKTLITSVTQLIAGMGIFIGSMKENSETIAIVAGLVIIGYGVIHWYLRGVTTKSLKAKDDI